ncbi:histidine-containing response regulator phosphotransferase Mpr1 [Schizosaccharomyces octosporus yFS286]|uniref:Histidine-containing response regulator phosphotransferase Mpr1 n=1 Tax=Schizosaccharomyces octosporus (strain yFS286) TaxID=483514 RepID=S9PYQ5_SCHOY|nr:histidine-containing response regulator phosphotransferase Mpr1 [Schizosaccharomyces octosporus yFS286]EPX74221.1 histidine-containing response regulator phosphotransferase Mpr1 [Schizosaccharomyces octosporus yFS286]
MNSNTSYDRNTENRTSKRNEQIRAASLARTLQSSGIAEKARSPSGSAVPHVYQRCASSGHANDSSIPITSNPAYLAMASRMSSSKGSPSSTSLVSEYSEGGSERQDKNKSEQIDISNYLSEKNLNRKNLPIASLEALVKEGVLSDELSFVAYDISFDDDVFQKPQMIDHTTFDQLLEMDDDDQHEFSKSIVFNYFEQAETTIKELHGALKQKDLKKLSSLGHFLKGSSAALGLTEMKNVCERIQNYGALRSRDGALTVPSEEIALDFIDRTLSIVEDVYSDVRSYLEKFYQDLIH